MDVKINPSEKNANITVISLSGRLDTQTAATSSTQIMEALERSSAGIIMDLAGMEFISSAGLSILLALRKKAEPGGKKIAIIGSGPSGITVALLDASKFDRMDQITHQFTKTVMARLPVVVFAELPTLVATPQKMIAAGSGNILGKSIALADLLSRAGGATRPASLDLSDEEVQRGLIESDFLRNRFIICKLGRSIGLPGCL